MSPGRWLVSVPASLAIHATALLLVLSLFPRASLPSAIVVELSEVVVNEASADRAGPARVTASARSRAPARAGLGEYRRAELAAPVALPAPTPPPRSSPAPTSHPPSLPTPSESREPGPELAMRNAAAPVIEAQVRDGSSLTIGTGQEGDAEDPASGVASTGDRKAELGTTALASTHGGSGSSLGPGAPEAGRGGVSNEKAATPARAGRAGTGEEVNPGLALAIPGARHGGEGSEYGPYLDRLRRQIQVSLRYPLAARRRGLSGTVHMEVVILPNGAIGSVSLVRSSSHPILDEAAMDTVRNLPPLPFPPELSLRPLRVRLPVVFELR